MLRLIGWLRRREPTRVGRSWWPWHSTRDLIGCTHTNTHTHTLTHTRARAKPSRAQLHLLVVVRLVDAREPADARAAKAHDACVAQIKDAGRDPAAVEELPQVVGRLVVAAD